MRHSGLITACEDGRRMVRTVRVLQRHADAGAGFASRTATNRVRHHQDRAGLGDGAIHIGGRTGFFQTILRQILTHGRDEHFVVRHVFSVAY